MCSAICAVSALVSLELLNHTHTLHVPHTPSASNRARMKVEYRRKELDIGVALSVTVGELKQGIAAKTGLHPTRQSLKVKQAEGADPKKARRRPACGGGDRQMWARWAGQRGAALCVVGGWAAHMSRDSSGWSTTADACRACGSW